MPRLLLSGRPDRRLAAAVLVAGTLIGWAAQAPPTHAQTPSPSPSASLAPGPATGAAGDQVVLLGRVIVDPGEAVSEVVIFSGRAQIGGLVRGDVVVFDGPIVVTGQVSGSVVAISGSVRLAATAQVGGDVLAHDRVRAEAGAKVSGSVREGVAFTIRGSLRALGVLLSWLALAVSTLVLGLLLVLLAPKGMERAAVVARTAPFPAAGWGLLLAFALPLLAVLATASILGLPLGLTLLLALAFLGFVAYVLTIFALGRLVVGTDRRPTLALLAGWGIATAVGIVPYLNVAVLVAGIVFGLGLMLVGAWRARGSSEPTHVVSRRRGGRHRAGAVSGFERSVSPSDASTSEETVTPAGDVAST